MEKSDVFFEKFDSGCVDDAVQPVAAGRLRFTRNQNPLLRLQPESRFRDHAETGGGVQNRHRFACLVRRGAPSVDDDADPDALVARLRGFGFNHVYYHIPLKSDLDGRLENFLAAAGRARLPVDLVIRQDAYFRVFRGGSLVRPLIPEKTTLPEMAEKIVDFNDGLPETDRIAGLTVVVAPHEFTTANVNRPKHLMYAWSPKTFGPGVDNDMLMKCTFNQLREIAVLLGDLPLTVGVPDFYHQLAAEGKISVGKVGDFLAIAPGRTRVLLQNSGNKASEAVQAVNLELQETRQKESVIVQLSLANHTSVTAGALRRRDWTDFTRNVQYLAGQWEKAPAFAGMVIDPFAFLELIHQEE